MTVMDSSHGRIVVLAHAWCIVTSLKYPHNEMLHSDGDRKKSFSDGNCACRLRQKDLLTRGIQCGFALRLRGVIYQGLDTTWIRIAFRCISMLGLSSSKESEKLVNLVSYSSYTGTSLGVKYNKEKMVLEARSWSHVGKSSANFGSILIVILGGEAIDFRNAVWKPDTLLSTLTLFSIHQFSSLRTLLSPIAITMWWRAGNVNTLPRLSAPHFQMALFIHSLKIWSVQQALTWIGISC